MVIDPLMDKGLLGSVPYTDSPAKFFNVSECLPGEHKNENGFCVPDTITPEEKKGWDYWLAKVNIGVDTLGNIIDALTGDRPKVDPYTGGLVRPSDKINPTTILITAGVVTVLGIAGIMVYNLAKKAK